MMIICRYTLLLILIVSFSFSTEAQFITVSGNITKNSTKENLQNATIYESVSGIGTIANSQGYFKLLLEKGDKKITFSETGFSPLIKEFYLQKDTVINVSLKQEQLLKSKDKEETQEIIANKTNRENPSKKRRFTLH